jgi:UDP-N-acetylglucosamine 3-dehydrogenase
MIRAAVIGVGSIGQHHARIYNELDGVELVAIADPSAARRERAARRFKVPTYLSHIELLESEQLDLVSVTVPTVLHHPVALSAIEHGVNLLVEKPIAATLEQAEDIIRQASERGLTLAVGHIERFNPAIVELKRRLEDDELGRIFQIQARRLSPFPSYVADVGVVLDLATHELDIMRYLLDCEAARLFAEVGRNVHPTHEDMLSAVLRFTNGVVGVLDINWLTPGKIRELRITGERGMFMVDYIHQDLYFYQNAEAPSRWDTLALFRGVEEGDVLKVRLNKTEPLERELRAFVKAVAEHSRPVVTGEDGRRALILAQALLTSANEGRMLHVGSDGYFHGT